MASKSLNEIVDHLGLTEYVKHDPASTKSEDIILKAFFGCLNNIVDDKIQKLFGYIYCYNLMENIFKDIIIEEIKPDAKTQLKELYEKMGWIQPQYIFSKLNKSNWIRKCVTKKDAELDAAENALENMAKRGFTIEMADKSKAERDEINNLEHEKQYQRVEEEVKRHNNQGKL